MPADPCAAGRKGGSRNTPAQQAARKRNGFQKQQPTPSPAPAAAQTPPVVPPPLAAPAARSFASPVLVAPRS